MVLPGVISYLLLGPPNRTIYINFCVFGKAKLVVILLLGDVNFETFIISLNTLFDFVYPDAREIN